jgi:hypothetical protein
MGGVGSGNWYRFDKKTTTGECHSVDVRYLSWGSLLEPGAGSLYVGRGPEGRRARSGAQSKEATGRSGCCSSIDTGAVRGMSGKMCRGLSPLPGRPATSAERGRGSSVREPDADGG